MRARSHTHSTKLGEVFLLRSLVLLILINPFVEVGLQEVDLLRVLQETRPVGLIELLLAQVDLDILGGVVDLALLGVNLGVELKFEVVCLLESVGVAGESERGGLQVQLEVGGGDVRDVDGQEDNVLCGVRGRRALGPKDYQGEAALATLWPEDVAIMFGRGIGTVAGGREGGREASRSPIGVSGEARRSSEVKINSDRGGREWLTLGSCCRHGEKVFVSSSRLELAG